MAKAKELSKIESISINLKTSLELAKEEYLINPTNPLSSIITDLQLTILELDKLK
jgi:hypothetical protein